MKVRRISVLWLGLVLFSASVWGQNNSRLEREKKDYLDALNTTGAVFANIQRYFVDTVNLARINEMALNAMLLRLDPYTQYMNPEDAKSFMEATSGEYAGVGALISQRPNGVVIINEPFEGLPADKAGLKAGDRILSINGKDFSNSTTPEVSKALRGEDGSTITVKVQRINEPSPRTFSFKRREIQLNSVDYSGIVSDNIGLIRISSFTRETGKDVKEAVNTLLNTKAVKGIIIDLRGNGGGVLQSGVELLSLFLPKGSHAVTVKGRTSDSNADYRTTTEPIVPLSIPMVVLIDNQSASASEIVAGAMQDIDRAVIMGNKSFGKGLVQSTIPLPDGGLLKLTTAQYYTPSGRNIQKITYHHFNDIDEPEKSVKSDADSLGTPFYTRNKRLVYASDGILPDVEASSPRYPILISHLSIDTLTYDYITQYIATHNKPSSPSEVVITPEEYSKFVNYLIDNKFQYTSSSKDIFKKLKECIELEGNEEYTKAELEALDKVLTPNLRTELERNQKEVIDYLESQIALRYFYRKGFFGKLLPTDDVVLKACELLHNPDKYNSLLSPKKP